MDAQHQKTNKSAQFACYLREHTSSSSITSYIYLFALLFSPSSICSSYTAHSSRTTRQASKQQRKGESFWGRPFFSFFFLVTETKGYDKNYLPTCLTLSRTGDCEPPNRELRLGNQTTMCDYTKVEYACYHLRYTVRAWCKSTYFSGHPFLFFSFFSFFFSFFLHIYLNVHGTADAFDMCVFRRQVPGDTQGTYLSYLFFFFFLSSLSFAIFLGIIAGYLAACYVVSK